MKNFLDRVKEYREVLILLAALMSLAWWRPDLAEPDAPTVLQQGAPTGPTLRQIAGTIDAMNRQLESLVRLQCQQSDRRSLELAGVTCHTGERP